MNCPFCTSTQLMVVNSRTNSKGTVVWRRRKCLDCNSLLTTYEKINLSYIVVIKKSGKRQRYNRAKLYSGIYHSAIDKKGFDKGDASNLAEDITNKIESEILRLRKREILSTEITEIALSVLRKKSPDTFLRYLAYREGGDIRRTNQLLKRYF